MALWSIQAQFHVASAHLVAHGGTCGTPIFKVVFDACFLIGQLIAQHVEWRLAEHRHRKPHLASHRHAHQSALATATLAREWIVRHLQPLVATTVFRRQSLHVDSKFGIIVFFNFIHCCFLAVKLHHPHPRSQQQ